MKNSGTSVPPDDFDFIIGSWIVNHRRLNERLSGCNEWTGFSGETTTRKALRGFGNFEDNVLHFPQGEVRAVALRSYDQETGKWAIWWLDGRSPHSLDVPVIGQFVGDVGTFIAHDTLNGVPIIVRFIWNRNSGGNPLWEQAFSSDGGESWETNWTMEFVRKPDQSTENGT